MDGYFRMRPDGLDLFVRLMPRASIDAIEGVGEAAGGSVHLIARVRAVPEKGAANSALERLVAQCFGLPKSAVSVVAGSTARLKSVRLSGEPAALAKAVESAIQLGRAAKPG